MLDISLIPGVTLNKFALAEAQLIRSSDLGATDSMPIYCRTHLGNVLRAGDSVLGYLLSRMNWNEDDVSALKGRTLQAEVL